MLHDLLGMARAGVGPGDLRAVLDDYLRRNTAALAHRSGLMCESDHHGRSDDRGGQASTVGEPKPAERCVTPTLCLVHVTSFRGDRKNSLIVI